MTNSSRGQQLIIEGFRLADHVLAGEGGRFDAGLLLLGHEDENLFISFQKLNDSIVLSGHNISEITLM